MPSACAASFIVSAATGSVTAIKIKALTNAGVLEPGSIIPNCAHSRLWGTGSFELEYVSLGSGEDIKPGCDAALILLIIANVPHNLVDGVIRSQWIVMGQCQTGCPCCSAHRDGIVDGTVSPSDLVRIFVQGELSVVDDEIGSGEKFAMLAVLPQYFPFA